MKEWSDDERIMISAIQHYSFCPRQCALIHIEQIFEENIFTVKGSIAHSRVDNVESVVEVDIRVERALPLWSDRLGLTGKADVVEFHGDIPYPVEYKLGKVKKTSSHSDLQLCAQAICLEEMMKIEVPAGAIFHVSSHRRREVIFTDEMRNRVEEIVAEVRKLFKSAVLPTPLNDWHCRDCSLERACLPEAVCDKEGVNDFRRLIFSEKE